MSALLKAEEQQEFSIRKSDKAKRVTLRVNPKTHDVELVVPRRVSIKYALEFAATQKDWIAQQKAKKPEVIPMIASEARALRREARKVLTDLTMEKIALLSSNTSSQRKPGSSLNLQRDFFYMLDSCFRRNDGTKEWNGKNIQIRINDAKTQWGSCHPDGRISYSWRLMLAPETARDYVVAHEVAHLIHNDHSRQFWELCAQLSVNFKEGHAWMKKHGQTLHHYQIAE